MTKNKSNKNHKNIVVPAKELPVEKHEKDWRHSQHWRVLRIMAEFIDGFQFLGDLKNSVTIFGLSATNKSRSSFLASVSFLRWESGYIL